LVTFSASEDSPREFQERSRILFGATWIEAKEIYFARLTKEAIVQRLAHSGDCLPSLKAPPPLGDRHPLP
jgi:hypothetical protein